MTQSEIKERYWEWQNDTSRQDLPYLEDWEQWHYSIELYDKELFNVIWNMRKELGIDKKQMLLG